MDLFDTANIEVSILDIYGKYVNPVNKTWKKGKRNNYVNVRCPFHEDRRPSLYLYDNNMWYCFSCGQEEGVSHDNVGFVAKLKNIDRTSAAKIICSDFGKTYDAPKPKHRYCGGRNGASPEEEAYEKQFLANMNQRLANLFHSYLASAPDRDYFKKRGLGSLVDEYLLGYCPQKSLFKPDTKPEVIATLKEHGICNDQGESVFAGRYIVPIRDMAGTIVGFIGRLPDSEIREGRPKYLNSCNSALFNKRKVFFNPQGMMTDSDKVFIVEGVFDALSYIAAGIKNVVSPLGSSLSDEHLKILKYRVARRVGKTIVLAFDRDEAGYEATERAIGYIRDMRVDIATGDFKGKKDANELLMSFGAAQVGSILTQSVPAPEYLISRYATTGLLKAISGQEKLWCALAKFLGSNEQGYRDRYPLNTAYTPVTFGIYWGKYRKAIDAVGTPQ